MEYFKIMINNKMANLKSTRNKNYYKYAYFNQGTMNSLLL